MNEIKIVNKAGRVPAVAEMESTGHAALRSGLGVMPGKYRFATPNSDSIYATKPIESAKGKFALTLIAGSLKGAESHNKETNMTFGLTSSDRQFVVSFDQWLQIEPNQSYDVEVLNGRIKSLSLMEGDNIVSSSEITANSKKQNVPV